MTKNDDIVLTAMGVLRTLGFLAMLAVMTPIAVGYKRLRPDDPFFVPRRFHTLLLRLLGMRVRVIGEPCRDAPVLFVANHASYLDIPVLGSMLNAGFVAKSEVAGWPLFGFLSRVQNTVFIERRTTRAAEQKTQLQDHLAQKQNLILFPEGTSSDGLTVLHFKSSLFGIIENDAGDAHVTVQPVSITCTELDGYPLLREERALYAWYGDMTMPPHLWNVFKRGGFTVEVIFHKPVPYASATDRKALAAQCEELVGQGIQKSLSAHTGL